jgi:hypothetical protein
MHMRSEELYVKIFGREIGRTKRMRRMIIIVLTNNLVSYIVLLLLLIYCVACLKEEARSTKNKI